MGNFKVVVPEATTNYIENPQFYNNITDGWTSTNGTHTRITTYSYIGPACYRIRGAVGVNAYTRADAFSLADGESVTLSVRMYRASDISAVMQVWDSTNSQIRATDSPSLTGEWELLEATWENTTGGAVNIRLTVINTEQTVSDIFFDAAQAEIKDHRTTFCDGTRDGCTWNGTAHNSTSTRSAVSRAGGQVKDLADDYSFYVTGWLGYGMPPQAMGVDSYAMLPGGELNQLKVETRSMVLVGEFVGTTLSNLHSLRQALEEELAPDRYPQDANGWQPVRIRYEGAAVDKETLVHYEGGLEGGVRDGFTERCLVRFLGVDPYWYQLGESSQILDTNDTAILRYCAGRLRSTGQWDDLGLTINPDTANWVRAICVASNQSVYFGGQWTDWNNAAVGGDYVIRFDPSDESWNVLVGASDVNNTVYDIKEGPDGTIYICGAFDSVNGDGTADNIVAYNPSSDTWSSLGDPDTTNITAMLEMEFDSDGNLYVVGNFTAVAGVSNTAYIAMWDGSSWNAVGTPSVGAGYVQTIAIDADDNIYIGGTFTNFAGDADADGIAWWNGSAWSDLGGITLSGFATVNDIAYDPALGLFFVGDFTNAAGDANADYAFRWNGTAVEALDTGLNALAYQVEIAPDNMVWVTGAFTQAGSISCYRKAIWNGATWVVQDCATTDDIYAIAFGDPGPVVAQNYDVFIGTDGSTSAEIAGIATATNGGTSPQYPIIVLKRSGGTSATLVSIRNETTGKRLYCAYGLLDGETLTIDLRPHRKRVTSSLFGERPDAILANSDFGSWRLLAGDNDVTCLVDVAGAPTITAWLVWRDAYAGAD